MRRSSESGRIGMMEGVASRYYDPQRGRIIYVDQPATPEFWDGNWANQFPTRKELLETTHSRWSRITEEFLKPADGPILEGGCGTGVHVAALQNAGFTTTGIDFAQKTVDQLHGIAPELDIRRGDVRKLEFEDAHFAGYWSLGVIEHFWEGYTPIADEAFRVLRPGGILFLAFPFVNAIRACKGRLRIIPRWDGTRPQGFYQFALDSRSVERDFRSLGFELLDRRNVLGRQGMAEEMPRFSANLQRLYDNRSRNVALRGVRRFLHELALRITPLACYSDLLILRKPTSTDATTAEAP